MITDHNPLVVRFKKDVAILSLRLQLQIVNQYKPVQHKHPIKLGPQLYIVNKLSRHNYTHHKVGRNHRNKHDYQRN